MQKRKQCNSCREYMGGGVCRANLEPECADGGGFEGWRPYERFETIEAAEGYVHSIGHRGGFRLSRDGGAYRLELEPESE